LKHGKFAQRLSTIFCGDNKQPLEKKAYRYLLECRKSRNNGVLSQKSVDGEQI
jgi:hypothetical protein